MEYFTRFFKDFAAKRKAQQRALEIATRKETILHNLTSDVTSEEALEIFKDIRSTFLARIQDRLTDVTEEKEKIEEFFKDK